MIQHPKLLWAVVLLAALPLLLAGCLNDESAASLVQIAAGSAGQAVEVLVVASLTEVLDLHAAEEHEEADGHTHDDETPVHEHEH